MTVVSVSKLAALAVALGFTLSCAEKSTFGGSSKKTKSQRDEPVSRDDVQKANKLESEPESEPEGNKTKFLSFNMEAIANPKVDYVFVVDNSGSMDKMIKSVSRGFTEIAEKSLFPKDARIGVMTTTVTESSQNGAKIVGFQDLANKNQIAKSRRSPEDKEKYPGCNKFFAPTEKDAAGNYCLVSAVQFELFGTIIEAGITAFQRMVAGAKKPVFRQNALVNVIFVSDTHEPGNNNQSLIQALKSKTYEAIKKEVAANSDILGLRFHAIAPIDTACSSEKTYNFSYNRLVEASNGTKKNCDTDEYASFMTEMVKGSVESEEISIDIPDNVSVVEKVTIAGEELEFKFEQEQGVLKIAANQSDYPEGGEVEVEVELE